MVIGYVVGLFEDVVDWIFLNVVFLNGMVDCIILVIGECEIVLVWDIFGVDDVVLVVCEFFC